MIVAESLLADLLQQHAHPLDGNDDDYDRLLALIGDARIVLLGEASHGTHEFYRERAAITRRLIRERDFNVVAVEADWPDAYRVDRFVRGDSDDADAGAALSGFLRFPTWMWRNTDVLEFVDWLRRHNDLPEHRARPVGFYGLDLYSLRTSMSAVIEHLERTDPAAAERARGRYACFDHYGEDVQAYGYAAGLELAESCEDGVIEQLGELHRRTRAGMRLDGRQLEDALFSAEQNARLVKNAEAYYRAMFRGRVSSWNLRDRHMAETLDALVAYFDRHAPPAKIVVWEHNSHLGDARATDMAELGEINVGQLVRERYGRAVRSIGFSTYEGTVTAASDWGDPPQRKRVRPGLSGSYEALFHALGRERFLLRPHDDAELAEALREPRLQRAIGVIYRPQTERVSHYFHARLSDQFDALLHFDRTDAVVPLERDALWDRGEPPETFPSGL